jgi:hypothetical protein
MPRPRYPSDDEWKEQRNPAVFRVHCSIQNHEKTLAVWADNNLLAAYVRLGVLCRDRGAGENADWVSLSAFDVQRITGRRRLDVARTSLELLANLVGWDFLHQGDITSIHFRNFSKKQGYAPRNSRTTPRELRSYSAKTPRRREKREEYPPIVPLAEEPAEPRPDPVEAELEQIREAYPKRDGSQQWPRARRALVAAKKRGEKFEAVLEGVKRYAAWAEARGIVGTGYVMQAARFLGPAEEWRLEWSPAVNGGPPAGGSPTARSYRSSSGSVFEVRLGQRVHWNTPEEIKAGAIEGYQTPRGEICLNPGGRFEG